MHSHEITERLCAGFKAMGWSYTYCLFGHHTEGIAVAEPYHIRIKYNSGIGNEYISITPGAGFFEDETTINPVTGKVSHTTINLVTGKISHTTNRLSSVVLENDITFTEKIAKEIRDILVPQSVRYLNEVLP
jgi:hypothetical protein